MKTKSILKKEQVERYIQKCKDNKIDALITISNEFVSSPYFTPIEGMRNRKNVYHFSWKYIATILHNVIDSGISDEEQVFIANQLLDYLDNHPYVLNFTSMGEFWKTASQTIVENNGKKTDYDEVVKSWLQEERDIALQL